MPHTTAIQAFNGVLHGAGSSLTQLYSALVTIELLTKDHIFASTGKWISGHNIFTALLQIDGSLSSSAAQLQGNLVTLICTDRSGNETTVKSTQYPDIRYLRHDNDVPAWSNSSAEITLQATLNDAKICLHQLKTLGIKP